MSDERPVFARFRCPFAGIAGNKLLTIEYFEARHWFWKIKHGAPVYPRPADVESVDWSKRYRLRVNGRWFGPRKLSFYTMAEASLLIEKLLSPGGHLLIEG